ncbi:hypothetical protein T08_11498 [Trichinella sp. T8]|nr:hypothetical protein T08_11498 [Trichinella sp. T8]
MKSIFITQSSYLTKLCESKIFNFADALKLKKSETLVLEIHLDYFQKYMTLKLLFLKRIYDNSVMFY